MDHTKFLQVTIKTLHSIPFNSPVSIIINTKKRSPETVIEFPDRFHTTRPQVFSRKTFIFPFLNLLPGHKDKKLITNGIPSDFLGRFCLDTELKLEEIEVSHTLGGV